MHDSNGPIPNKNDLEERKLALEFEELSGRSTPPDVLDAVLARAQQPEMVQAQEKRTPWLAAALVLLAVSVTVGIGLMSQDPIPTPDVTPAAQFGAAQDTPKQDKKKAKAEKPAEKPKAVKNPIQRLAEIQKKQALAEAYRAKIKELIRKGGEVQDKQKSKVGGGKLKKRKSDPKATQDIKRADEELARIQAQLKALQGGGGGVRGRFRVIPPVVQGQPLNVARKKAIELEMKALRGKLLKQRALRDNPLLRGEYSKSLEKIRTQREELLRTKDPKAAAKLIDAMSLELSNARRHLWQQKQAKKKN